MEYAIKTEGLEKRFDSFALGPLNIEVPTGTVIGLVGPNGAGKTTLIKCLLGITQPTAGCMEILGTTIAHPRDLADALKERIGVVLDACSFTQESRVRDVGQLGRAAYRQWNPDMFAELIASFGIAPNKKVRDLSRGMGMKLMLAFALAHSPNLLILDEATAGLDPLARDEVLDMMREFMLTEGHSILMSSHITSDLEKLADRIVCINDGQVLFDMPKDAICDEAGVAHCKEAQLAVLVAETSGESALGPLGAGRTEGDDREPLHVLRGTYGTDVLVPDRFAFAKAHPDIPVDGISLDDYLAFFMKGESL